MTPSRPTTSALHWTSMNSSPRRPEHLVDQDRSELLVSGPDPVHEIAQQLVQKLNAPSKKAKAEKATKAPDKPGSSAAGQLAASKAKVLEASRQWWKQAKTINNGEAPEGIVSCKLPEGMKFMSKDDCVVQGGRPGDASS